MEGLTRRVIAMEVELQADLNSEDDDGLNWGLLRNASDPALVRPGAVMRAGSPRSWAWVRIESVDADGQVHFRQLTDDELAAHRRGVPTAT